MKTKININIDYAHVEPHQLPADWKTIVFPDMHGSAAKLIMLLTSIGIIPHVVAKRLVSIYNHYADVDNTQQKWEVICRFRDTLLATRCLWTSKAIHTKKIILLGDLLADRGHCDYFSLYIILFLHEQKINFIIIYSNHDDIFLNFTEKLFFQKKLYSEFIGNFSCVSLEEMIQVLFNINAPLFSYYKNLSNGTIETLLNRALITFEIFNQAFTSERGTELFKLHSVYCQYLCLMHYEKKILLTHAPTSIEVLTALITFIDKGTPSRLDWHDQAKCHKMASRLNSALQKHIKSNTVSTLRNRTSLNLPDCEYLWKLPNADRSIFYNFIWMSKAKQQQFFTAPFCNIFGHVSDHFKIPAKKFFINLDANNLVGKGSYVGLKKSNTFLQLEAERSLEVELLCGDVPCYVY